MSVRRFAITTSEADEDEHRHQHRVVARVDGVVGQAAKAGPGEHGLGQHRAGDQRLDVEADDGDDRQHGIAQRVLVDDGALAQSLGAGEDDVFEPQHLQHVGARQPGDQRQVEERERDGGQHQVVRDVERRAERAEIVAQRQHALRGKPAELVGEDAASASGRARTPAWRSR